MRGRRTFSQFKRPVADAAAKALYREASQIIAESQRLVPVDTGTLRASARVGEPVDDGDRLTVTAGYGYGDEYREYATAKALGDMDGDEHYTSGPGYGVYVHERLDVHHAPPTQAKFLEQPAAEHQAGFSGRIAVEIRKAFRTRRSAA